MGEYTTEQILLGPVAQARALARCIRESAKEPRVPPELANLNARHTPNSNLLIDLAQSFGFLKSLVEPYKAANLAGMDVVHLQTFEA